MATARSFGGWQRGLAGGALQAFGSDLGQGGLVWPPAGLLRLGWRDAVVGIGGSALRRLQRGSRSLTGPIWARLGRGSGVLPRLRPVCYGLCQWRLSPPTWPLTLLLLVFGWFLSIPPVSLRLSR